jgi:DNA-binding HxlR family transcriptional regulator
MTQATTITAAEALGPRCREVDPDGLMREMLTIIGDKWTVLVIGHLQDGPVRFTRIMEQLPAISHRMLTRTLRTLERDGIVSRTVYPESPPRVEYDLTPLGHTLIEPLAGLHRWALEHRDEITAHRDRAA